MSAKENKLRAAMFGVQGRSEDTALSAEPPSTPISAQKRPVQTRLGKRAFGGFISNEGYRQLHLIGIDTNSSIQELLIEALNDFFRKHNMSAIA